MFLMFLFNWKWLQGRNEAGIRLLIHWFHSLLFWWINFIHWDSLSFDCFCLECWMWLMFFCRNFFNFCFLISCSFFYIYCFHFNLLFRFKYVSIFIPWKCTYFFTLVFFLIFLSTYFFWLLKKKIELFTYIPFTIHITVKYIIII